jgi:myosin heavy subunit
MSDGGYSDEDNSTIDFDDYNAIVRANNQLETENSLLGLKVRQLTSELARFKIETGISPEFQFIVVASDLLKKYDGTLFIPDICIPFFRETNRQTLGLLRRLANSEPLSLTTKDIKLAQKIVLEATLTEKTLLSPFLKTANLMKQAFKLLDYNCEGKFYTYKFDMSDGKHLGIRFPQLCQVRGDMHSVFVKAYGRFVDEEATRWNRFIDQAIYMQVQSFLISITHWQDVALLNDDLIKRKEVEKKEYERLKEVSDLERRELMAKESDFKKREMSSMQQKESNIKIIKKVSIRTQTDEVEPPVDPNVEIMKSELIKLRKEKTVWLESKKEMIGKLRDQEQALKDLERELKSAQEVAKSQVSSVELKKFEEIIKQTHEENDSLISENKNLNVDIQNITQSNTKLLAEAENARQKNMFLNRRVSDLEVELDKKDDEMREVGADADNLINSFKEKINEGLSREDDDKRLIKHMEDEIAKLKSIDMTKNLRHGIQTDIDFTHLQSLNDKYDLKVRQICDAFYATGNAIESAKFVEDVIKRVCELEIKKEAKLLEKEVPKLEEEIKILNDKLSAMERNTTEFQISQETGHLNILKKEVSEIFSSIASKEINSFQHNMRILSSDMNNMMAAWKALPQKAKRFGELNNSDDSGNNDGNKIKDKGENEKRVVGENKKMKEKTKIASVEKTIKKNNKDNNIKTEEETEKTIKKQGNNKNMGTKIIYKNEHIMLPNEERLSLDNKNFGKPNLIRSVSNPVSRPDEKLWRELDQSEITFDDWNARLRVKEFLSNDEVRPHDDRMCQGEWWMQKNVNIRLRLRRENFISVEKSKRN